MTVVPIVIGCAWYSHHSFSTETKGLRNRRMSRDHLNDSIVDIGLNTEKSPGNLRRLHHHHHHVPIARISLTLSRHFSLLFIASGRSSGLHRLSSHSCCMFVRAGCPAFAWPYVGVHRSTSLMSSSLLLWQCPACLVRLTCIVFVMGGRWLYSWCLVGVLLPGLLRRLAVTQTPATDHQLTLM